MKSFCALLLCLWVAHVSAFGQDDGINWLGSYEEAILEARKTGKPIFLEFRCEA